MSDFVEGLVMFQMNKLLAREIKNSPQISFQDKWHKLSGLKSIAS